MATKYRGCWKVRWTHHGKRFSKTFPKGTKKEAVDQFERDLRTKLLTGRASIECPTLAEYVPRFFRVYASIKSREESTLIKHRSDLKHHILPVFGNMRLSDISPADVLDFQVSLLRQDAEVVGKLSPQSVRNVRGNLSVILKMAVIERLIEYNPCSCVPNVQKQERTPNFWTEEETDRFLCHAQETDWELFQLCAFAVNTGMRPGELQALKRDCLDFDSRFVIVRRNFCTKTGRINEYTKTKSVRKISLSPPIWHLMLNKRNLGPAVLVFPFVFNSLGFRRVQPLARQAGVKPIRFHDLRHSFASHLIMGGRNLVEVQELLGHKKLDSTRIYAHLTDEYKQGITDRLVEGKKWVKSLDTKVVSIVGVK